MRAWPILMHERAVCGTLDGHKTQTRRPVKFPLKCKAHGASINSIHSGDEPEVLQYCPYGQPGDLLWVRETLEAESYGSTGWNDIWYSADSDGLDIEPPPSWSPPWNSIRTHKELGGNIPEGGFDWFTATIPSIFMPRWASRLTLLVTDVRVERVQEISETDAQAEGADWMHEDHLGQTFGSHRRGFEKLWKDIYGPGAWDRNDWVWVIEYRTIHANVDDVLANPERHGIREPANDHI